MLECTERVGDGVDLGAHARTEEARGFAAELHVFGDVLGRVFGEAIPSTYVPEAGVFFAFAGGGAFLALSLALRKASEREDQNGDT